jgi:RNA polymerase sigma-70 factor (ECF subfamily)
VFVEACERTSNVEPGRPNGVTVPESTSFDQFYATTARRVVAQVCAMVGDLGEAEDAVAEAYARAWQRWHHVAGYADPVAWVRTVAYRIAVSSWRRTRNRLVAQERWGRSTPAAQVDPDTVALVAALRQIPAAQRRAIVLHHLVGLTVREIALETGVSVSAVKLRLSRGRRALGPLLGLAGPEPVASGPVAGAEVMEVDHG